jgi:hypothetical protein
MNKFRSNIFICLFFSVVFPNIVNAQWVSTNGPGGGSIFDLAVSGSNIFAGTSTGGIFISTNNGTSWTEVNTGLTNKPSVQAFAIKDNLIFAGTVNGGIFISTNNGATWAAANTGLTKNIIWSLVVSGTTVFAGAMKGGVFRSTNNGNNWIAVNNGIPDTASVTSFAVNGNKIFAGTESFGVYLSDDNGTSWSAVDSGLTNTSVYALSVSDTNIFAGTFSGVFLSTNNGASWKEVDSGLTDKRIKSFTSKDNIAFAGNWNYGGLFLSINIGTSWTAVKTGLPSTSIQSIAIGNNNVFVGTDYGTVWRRPISEMLALPSQVVLVSPKDSLVISSDSIQLKWQKSTDAVSRYHLQIATDSSLNFSLHDSTITDTTKVFKPLTNGQCYWWRVRAFNAAGWGVFSLKRKFSYVTTTTFSKPLKSRFFSCESSSNGFQYTIPVRCQVSLLFFDVRGRMISVSVDGNQNAGVYSLHLPVATWPKGTYVQVFKAGSFVKIDKISVVR